MLFHHDPLHGDDDMDNIARDASQLAARMGVPKLTVARDGMRLRLEPHASRSHDAGAE